MRHLQHIETEDWDALPAPTYAIGFARNYANAVGLDGAGHRQRAARHDRRPAPARARARILRAGRSRPGAAALDRASSPLLLAVLLVGGYLIWRSLGGADDETTIAVPDAPGPAPAQNQAAAAPRARGRWPARASPSPRPATSG